MTVLDFIEKLKIIEVKLEQISALYHIFACEFTDDVLNFKKEEVETALKYLSDEESASFGMKLGRCFSDCQDELENLASMSDTDYSKKIVKVEKLFQDLVTIYYEVSKKSTKTDNTSTTISQHEEYLKEVKSKLKDLNSAVENANKLIDDKIFTLLINTVAILGIFVAIAFAGFGMTSIFSNIDFSQAFISSGNLVKSVFFLFLVSLLSYNLLFLLVYFIYKLSRPLILKVKQDDDGNDLLETFSNTMNLCPFIWIDVIMCVLTIGLFVWCQFI
ncbi:MAG: hypothetical protein II306_03745 [Clostridia bacterium]|nr:hypothetical protein [Clostridia bacterium]